MELLLLSFLLGVYALGVSASPRPLQYGQVGIDVFPITKGFGELFGRQDLTQAVSTCGFSDGQPRTAVKGWKCVVDTTNGYWGFCPTGIAEVSDCPISKACTDSSSCSTGCGLKEVGTATAFLCTKRGEEFCNQDLLSAGPGQTYTYFSCASTYGSDIFSAASEFVTAPGSTVNAQPTAASASPSMTATTTPLPTSAPASNESSKGASNTGAIVGGVIGGLALLLIAGVALYYIRRRSRNSNSVAKDFPDGDPPEYVASSTKYAHVEMEHPPTELPGVIPVSELSHSPTQVRPRST